MLVPRVVGAGLAKLVARARKAPLTRVFGRQNNVKGRQNVFLGKVKREFASKNLRKGRRFFTVEPEHCCCRTNREGRMLFGASHPHSLPQFVLDKDVYNV